MHETENLIPLEHMPLAPPRPGTPGEGIYLKLWRDYVGPKPGRLEHILRNAGGVVTQRDASVCASFMVFMGCNGGRSLHQCAEQLLSRSNMRPHEAFMAAWALQNERCRSINHGLRTIEYMLAAEHPIDTTNPGPHCINWSLVPEVTMRDIDVIECMVAWWATIEGQEMRAVAEPIIEAENRRLLSNLFR